MRRKSKREGAHVCLWLIHLAVQWELRQVFPSGVVQNPPADAGDMSSTPGSGRSPGEGNDNPL